MKSYFRSPFGLVCLQFAEVCSFVTGVIAREAVPGFERLLWRACRGNVFMRNVPIDENLKVCQL